MWTSHCERTCHIVLMLSQNPRWWYLFLFFVVHFHVCFSLVVTPVFLGIIQEKPNNTNQTQKPFFSASIIPVFSHVWQWFLNSLSVVCLTRQNKSLRSLINSRQITSLFSVSMFGASALAICLTQKKTDKRMTERKVFFAMKKKKNVFWQEEKERQILLMFECEV